MIQAAGQIFCPDTRDRRRLTKATVRQRKAEKRQKSQDVLHETGIRELRRKPVFTTPNSLPPAESADPVEVENPDFREVLEPQNCYICKKDYNQIHHFYDQLCPTCAELNWFKRTELGFTADDFVIGMCAVFRPEKNHLQLVEAVAAFAEGAPIRIANPEALSHPIVVPASW